ncbi:PLP-dependent aminotransferase family protein [Alcaligenaceae bacterium CGII-47]|nr:PLP-dependent aminotransferase family protein [Alcaligenaceae bacterium CGII-47]
MPLNLVSFPPQDKSQALYLQIANWIEQNITENRLLPGDQLPTVRVLAQFLGVNRGSIASAYKHLSNTGVLLAHVGKGTFVNAAAARSTETETGSSGQLFWEPLLAEAATRIGLGKPAMANIGRDTIWVPDRGEASEPDTQISMDMPLANHHLGYALIRKTLREITDELPVDTLAYNHPQGMHSLRVQLTELARHQNLLLSPQQIMICNGAQQALSLLSSLLIRPGDTVITEDPSYPGATRAFRMAGAKIIGIPVDDGGMRVDVLDGILRNHQPKLIYTVPSFHAPTGTTLNIERRLHLYRLAQKHQVPILEDEYVNSLYYGEPPPDPIKSLDRSGLVAYIGTFSKTLGASMRLGWIAAHPDLIARLVQVKELHDIHSSIFSQLIAERLLLEGSYLTHLDELRQHYRLLYHTLLGKLTHHTKLTIQKNTYHGGFSVWVALPNEITASDWLVYARARGVTFDLGKPYFLGGGSDQYARLCFSLLSISDINNAADILQESLVEALAKQSRHTTRRDRFLPFS